MYWASSRQSLLTVAVQSQTRMLLCEVCGLVLWLLFSYLVCSRFCFSNDGKGADTRWSMGEGSGNCPLERDTKMLLCWADVLPEITLSSLFAAQTKLEDFVSNILWFFCCSQIGTSFWFLESDCKVICAYCQLHKEGELCWLYVLSVLATYFKKVVV